MGLTVGIVASTNYFVIKFIAVWAVVLSLFLVLRISYPIPIPRPATFPLWLLGFLDLLSSYGMTFILAGLLAGIWQLAVKL